MYAKYVLSAYERLENVSAGCTNIWKWTDSKMMKIKY